MYKIKILASLSYYMILTFYQCFQNSYIIYLYSLDRVTAINVWI